MRRPTDQEILNRVLDEYDDGFYDEFEPRPRARVVVRPGHRIWGKTVHEDGHYLWVGSVDSNGYPVMKLDGQLRSVRRVVFEIVTKSRLNTGAFIKTTCGVRDCVRPEHLEKWE